MASVYILRSDILNKFYIGSCNHLPQRIADHNYKTYKNSFTASANDWRLCFSIDEVEGDIARKIEGHIKAMKSKTYIENLMKFPEMGEALLSRFSSK